MVLDRDLGDLLLSGAVLAHVLCAGLAEDARHQAGAHDTFGAVGAVAAAAGAQEAHLTHLLAADCQRRVVSAGSDCVVGFAEGRGASGAGVGYVDDGDARGADLLHHALADHGVRLVEVAADDELDVLDRAAGVLERGDGSLRRELDDVLVRVAPELEHVYADDCYITHCGFLPFPVYELGASRVPTGRSKRCRYRTLNLAATTSLPSRS